MKNKVLSTLKSIQKTNNKVTGAYFINFPCTNIKYNELGEETRTQYVEKAIDLSFSDNPEPNTISFSSIFEEYCPHRKPEIDILMPSLVLTEDMLKEMLKTLRKAKKLGLKSVRL